MLELFTIAGNIALQGQAAVEAALAEIEAEAQETDSVLMSLGEGFERLGDGITDVGGTMTKWVTGPLAAVSAGVGALIGKASTYTRDLDRMAQISNTTTTEFQKQAYAVRSVGVESENYSDILKDVNDKVGDFLTTGGGPMKDFFEEVAPQVGITAEQFRNLSGPDALQLYVSSLEKANLTQAEMTFYMEALGNDSTALLPLLQNNGQAMKQLGDEAERTGLILSEETLEATRKARGDMGKFKQALEVVTVQIGAALVPVLQSLVPVLIDVVVPAAKSFADVLSGMVAAFNALPQPVQSMIVKLVGLAAAIGPLLMIVGKVISLIGALSKAFAVLRIAALVLTPALIPVLTAMAPFIAIGAAIAGAIWLVWEAVNMVVEAFGGWEEVTKALVEVLDQAWEAIKAGVTAMAEITWEAIEKVIQFYVDMYSGIWDAVKAGSSTLMEMFSGFWDSVVELWSGGVSGVIELAVNFVSGVVDTISQMPGQVVDLISQMVQSVVDYFVNMGTVAMQAVQNMVASVVTYVQNMAANVIKSIKSMFMAVVGNSIIPDMARGVLDEFSGMTDGAVRDTESLVKGVNGTLDGIKSNIAPSVNVGGAAASGGAAAGGNVTVDMRHSVMRDDKDMHNRLRRKGVQLTGAF